jgi:DNA-binding protein H-NS
MPALNVDKLSLKELIALDAKIKVALANARAKGKSEIKQKMADLARSHGFDVSELFGNQRGNRVGKGIAKYANPTDATDTWTGRGRKPNWLVARMKKGAKLSDFEI